MVTIKTQADIIKNIIRHVRKQRKVINGVATCSETAATLAQLINALIDDNQNEELEYLFEHITVFEKYLDSYWGEDC